MGIWFKVEEFLWLAISSRIISPKRIVKQTRSSSLIILLKMDGDFKPKNRVNVIIDQYLLERFPKLKEALTSECEFIEISAGRLHSKEQTNRFHYHIYFENSNDIEITDSRTFHWNCEAAIHLPGFCNALLFAPWNCVPVLYHDPIAINETPIIESGNAGIDLYVSKTYELKKHTVAELTFGNSVVVPIDYVGLLTLRSSMTKQLMSSTGIIDSGYTGPLRLRVFVLDDCELEEGQRVAQIVLVSRNSLGCENNNNLAIVRVPDLSGLMTGRNTFGLGSSGKFYPRFYDKTYCFNQQMENHHLALSAATSVPNWEVLYSFWETDNSNEENSSSSSSSNSSSYYYESSDDSNRRRRRSDYESSCNNNSDDPSSPYSPRIKVAKMSEEELSNESTELQPQSPQT